MSKAFAPVKGMHDILPDVIPYWHRAEAVFRDVLGRYGYGELRMPILEHAELFSRSIGEGTDIVDKEMFAFQTRGGTAVCMRPEGTAGVVRAGISNGLLHNQRQRLWYTGPMFRYEAPQAGRYRQFYQFGAEVFGLKGPDIDAEILLMLQRIWSQLGLADVKLLINTLGDDESRRRYRATLVDYFSANQDALDADSRRRLTSNPLRILDSKNPAMAPLISAAPDMIDSLDTAAREHFDGVRSRLDAAGLAYVVEPRLVRGLDYYTRTVFEFQSEALGAQNAICGGGRYDNLVADMGGRATPGIGFAGGLDRLVAIMQAHDATIASAAPHAYLLSVGAEPAAAALQLAETLRDALPALRLVCHGNEGSFKAQMRAADKSGAAVAIVLGESELAQRVVGLKPLRTREEQETVGWSDVASAISRFIE